MKQTVILLLLAIIIHSGCVHHDEPAIYQETGVVVDFAGVDHCKFIIELENGKRIQPLYYPAHFTFYEGQKLKIRYSELPNNISTCGKGIPGELIQVEEISSGAPITEIETEMLNEIPDDPVFIHHIFVKDDYLQVKVSYSGGCRNHDFQLVKIESQESPDGTAQLTLKHNSNEDFCEAALSKELRFSITSLITQGYTHISFQAKLHDGSIFTELIEL